MNMSTEGRLTKLIKSEVLSGSTCGLEESGRPISNVDELSGNSRRCPYHPLPCCAVELNMLDIGWRCFAGNDSPETAKTQMSSHALGCAILASHDPNCPFVNLDAACRTSEV